ncbi:methylated-DNA--[protein]-cysteine S-methyltransferase [Bordetella holmesii]|uniref:Methylated-DNA--protein-cysteine methyltransferase n=2 Tax=Bordetella holmesii TaxID=35814 RepID=A0A158M5J2_9BORD|nr:methylated-DNA--[protein]-cysteine S-methyltransferase [Bordetella holmesii]AMD47103.1 cysteine methyltransferase [Bordetella holmesii H558]AMD47524.1 methylated-DNA--protein-cysteine methyltransferase [Bordetella holmesii F627]AOB36004.1 cysteine methyltransferase [Bordetella holmesii]AUL19974.1 cysteine methyltransferase [Bordetella holmesii]AUL23314.1 cysteine methyltransferase [Bordetella holmesii]
MMYSHDYLSPLGPLLLTSDGHHLTGLWIAGQKYHGGSIRAPLTPAPDRAEFKRVEHWLDAYFRGAKPALADLDLAPQGTPFRQCVWQALREIPYGQTTTYGAIARQIAEQTGNRPVAGQAVGGAVGHNPISIIIPCHRVVGSSGSLTGYAGGLHRKLRLLALEGVDTTAFFLPRKSTAA